MLAITALMFVVVVSLSMIFISVLLQHRVEEVYHTGDLATYEIFTAARYSMEQGFASGKVNFQDPEAVHRKALDSISNDPTLQNLLNAIVVYSNVVSAAYIVDNDNVVLMHSLSDRHGEVEEPRLNFLHVYQASFLGKWRGVFGKTHEYTLNRAILLNDKTVASVRVNVNTVLILHELGPQLQRALAFSLFSLLVSIMLSAALSNLALRPLELIGEQLDRMTFAEAVAGPKPAARLDDEYGVVSSKVDRIGRQMRDVQEVFTALKDNLDQIMANLQDGIMLFTREAKAVLVSASVEPFLGRQRRDLLGYSIAEIFRNGRNSSPLDTLVRNAFYDHHAFQGLEVKNRAGKLVIASLDFIEENGEGLGALLTLRDAESAQKIEDELELSRRLSAIGRLTSGVAHEVKNPINAIVVHLEVLRQKLQHLPPETRRHMDVITNEIHRLDRVVQTLVDFYRPVELKRAAFGLNRLVEDVVMLARLEAASHGHRVEVRLSPLPLTVRADYDMVKQALLNIVINGLQAMQELPSATLTITTATAHDKVGVIRVRDEGTGIPPEIQDKVFNLYFTTKDSGSGIGLAMTYRVLQLHSGSLSFKTSDRGTEFCMELPLAETAAPSRESTRQETA